MFKKLNQGDSRSLSKKKIGITEIAHQISPTTNLFRDKLELSIYEKIYPHITIGIRETILIRSMEKIFCIIKGRIQEGNASVIVSQNSSSHKKRYSFKYLLTFFYFFPLNIL